MSNVEVATKIVLGKRIIEGMARDYFWRNLVANDLDKFEKVVGDTMERMPMPSDFDANNQTDESLSDLLFDWTVKVRGAVALAFLTSQE